MFIPQQLDVLPLGFAEQLALQLLDWPVITVVAVLVMIGLYRKEIGKLLSRGGVALVWGDKTLAISEPPGESDESLAPVTDAIEELQERLTAVEQVLAQQPTGQPISSALNEQQREPIRERMLKALESSAYRWRSISDLASIGGITEPQAREILETLSSEATVVLSRGKSGRDIVRLENR